MPEIKLTEIKFSDADDLIYFVPFHPVRGERKPDIPTEFHTPRDVTTWLFHRIGKVRVGEIEKVLIEFANNYNKQ